MKFRFVLITILLSTYTITFAKWYESYNKAMDAIKDKQWQEALVHINEAISDQSDAKTNAKTYGLRFIDYLPYAYRGFIHYNMGNYEEALSDFENAQQSGELRKANRDKRAVKIVREFLPKTRTKVAESNEKLVAEGVFQEAVKLYEQKRFRLARQRFEAILDRIPDHAEARDYLQKLSRMEQSAKAEIAEDKPEAPVDAVDSPTDDFEVSDSPVDKVNISSKKTTEIDRSTADNARRKKPEVISTSYLDEAEELFDSGEIKSAKLKIVDYKRLGGSEKRAEQLLNTIEQLEQNARGGIRAFFEGDTEKSIEMLEQVTSVWSRNSVLKSFIGYAYVSKYLMTGSTDLDLLTRATEIFSQIDNPANYSNRKYISPKVLELVESLRQK